MGMFSPAQKADRVEGRVTERTGRGATSSQRRLFVSQLPLAGGGPCVDRHMDMSEEERHKIWGVKGVLKDESFTLEAKQRGKL